MKVLLRVIQILLLVALGSGAFLLRCHNLRETFIEGRIYFVEADCYSRMSRVQMVAAHPLHAVHYQNFENYPDGLRSHATAPLDYLILAGKCFLDALFQVGSNGAQSLLARQTLDLAGALTPPLFGALGAVFLALWAWWITDANGFQSQGLRMLGTAAPALLFAVSPILVHGTILGRPDHQALLIPLLVMALGAELILLRSAGSEPPISTGRNWSVFAGISWGFALWVSLYEPLILLIACAAIVAVMDRGSFRGRERRTEGITLLALILIFLIVEGWPIRRIAPEVLQFFPAWSRTIGELEHVRITDPIFLRWLGYLCVASPFLLYVARTLDRRALACLALWIATVALTCWQVRWAYFMALIFCLSLPWQIAALRRWWIAAPVLLVSLFGTAAYWDGIFFPDRSEQERRTSHRVENARMREVAERMIGEWPQPFIAPWWESPALAYWSGQPGVAGSSHQSLPGIVDVARFYLDSAAAAQPAAPQILARRKVAYVVADDTDRMLGPALRLLGETPASDALAVRLHDDPYTAEPYLVPVYSNLFFTLFAVDRTRLKP